MDRALATALPLQLRVKHAQHAALAGKRRSNCLRGWQQQARMQGCIQGSLAAGQMS